MLKEYKCLNEADAMEMWIDDLDRCKQYTEKGLKVYYRTMPNNGYQNEKWKLYEGKERNKYSGKFTYEEFSVIYALARKIGHEAAAKQLKIRSARVYDLYCRDNYYMGFKQRYEKENK